MPFLGSLLYDRIQINGYRFQQFLHFPDLWIMVFCENSCIGKLSRHFHIYEYDFQKIYGLTGILFI